MELARHLRQDPDRQGLQGHVVWLAQRVPVDDTQRHQRRAVQRRAHRQLQLITQPSVRQYPNTVRGLADLPHQAKITWRECRLVCIMDISGCSAVGSAYGWGP